MVTRLIIDVREYDNEQGIDFLDWFQEIQQLIFLWEIFTQLFELLHWFFEITRKQGIGLF